MYNKFSYFQGGTLPFEVRKVDEFREKISIAGPLDFAFRFWWSEIQVEHSFISSYYSFWQFVFHHLFHTVVFKFFCKYRGHYWQALHKYGLEIL